MGKKKFNWKSRQVVKTVIDDSKTKKIQVEFNADESNYDECNALVLPSKKRDTKVKKPKQQITRILTKKQRKHLQKIVEKKKKKENRATLLEALSKVQVSTDELKELTSISSVQTKGLRKYFQEQENEQKPKRKYEETIDFDVKINSISGSKRMCLLSSLPENRSSNPNIVGFEQSDTEDSDDESFTERDTAKMATNCAENDEIIRDKTQVVEENQSLEFEKFKETEENGERSTRTENSTDNESENSALIHNNAKNKLGENESEESEEGDSVSNKNRKSEVVSKKDQKSKVTMKKIKNQGEESEEENYNFYNIKKSSTVRKKVKSKSKRLKTEESEEESDKTNKKSSAVSRKVKKRPELNETDNTAQNSDSALKTKRKPKEEEESEEGIESTDKKLQTKILKKAKKASKTGETGNSDSVLKAKRKPKESAKNARKRTEREGSEEESENTEEKPQTKISKKAKNSPKKGETKNSDNVEEKSTKKPENSESEAKKAESKIEKKAGRNPVVFVPVNRSPDIQKSRLKLPILAEEQEIMETINENAVILLAGETGSGKTTQVPQFLYEAGFATDKIIGITEPRRVAAIAMSKRVAEEMNLSPKEVSYLIRFEGNVSENTQVKFMTDGVLLKELQSDFLLTKYSVIILDEAHERSVYTDILIGLLSRIVPLRHKKGDPLKLIIMSATLRLGDFTENSRLFKITPPVIKVDARQFPVTVHFNKRTPDDYVKEAYRKTIKIHTKLPDGAILVFVTGQLEVNRLVRRLRQAFPLKPHNKHAQGNSFKNTHKKNEQDASKNDEYSNDSGEDSDVDFSSDFDRRRKKQQRHKRKKVVTLPQINLDDYSMPGQEEDNEEFESDDSDGDDFEIENYPNSQPLWTLPLYSMLPTAKQQKVFQPPPEGCRLCVVATNVAETSLTIPNVKYVVDTGKTKAKLYDKVTGVTSYQVTWTSKASANQRAGRAGRVGPGHCYRLYSSAVFNDVFLQFSTPEIQQKPVDDLYLQMKCMNIDKIINFPFPSTPDLLQLRTAEQRLETLGALKKNQLTPLGKAIAQFPVLPRFGKMLALSHQQDLLPCTVCMVAALSVQEVLLETPIIVRDVEEAKELRKKWLVVRKKWAGQGNSLLLGDPLVLLKAVGAAEYANSEGKLEKFCEENGLRHKAVVEIRKLRMQLSNEIKMNISDSNVVVDPKLKPPTENQARLLRQILLAGMGDQVAKRVDQTELKTNEDKIKYKYAYRTIEMEEPVFMHSNSVLKSSFPEFVIYQEIYETNKMYMRGVTAIEPQWLPLYVPSICNLSEPLLDPEPYYDPNRDKVFCMVSGTFGKRGWELPNVEIEFPQIVNLYKWFAKFLLEGKVFKKLEKYTGSLLSTPNVMVKSWAKLQPRTEIILKTLAGRNACSKEVLEDIWSVEPKYLLSEYLKWLPESAHGEISLLWPPVD